MRKLAQVVGGNLQNYMNNGNWDYAQVKPGTTFAAMGNADRIADRWAKRIDGAFTATTTRTFLTDVPSVANSGFYSARSLRLSPDGTETIAADKDMRIQHIVEGYDFASLMGKNCTFSFWVRSNKPGIYCAFFHTNSPQNSYVVEYTIDAANVWQFIEIPVFFDPAVGGFGFINNFGVRIGLSLIAGSNYFPAATETWEAGFFMATANQVNFYDSTSNTIEFAQMGLWEGPARKRFQRMGRTIQDELEICQRHYEKSYNLDAEPGTAQQLGKILETTTIDNATARMVHVQFAVSKRDTPGNIRIYSPDGTVNTMAVSGGGNRNAAAENGGNRGFNTRVDTSGLGTGDLFDFQWAADSELA